MFHLLALARATLYKSGFFYATFILACVCVLVLFGACTRSEQQHIDASLSVVESVNTDDSTGFARVTEPRVFAFPQDHGPHPAYQTEWWYYTGNLATHDGRRFGFQLTFFRRGIRPDISQRDSHWSTNAIYMAHLAITDVEGQEFAAYERFSRDGIGLAGASGDPYRVFLDDWSVEGSGPEGMRMHLEADASNHALDLVAESTKPVTLQGDGGLSQKGTTPGNASYYYSLTRMQTAGWIRVADEVYQVEGLTWMDHEFGTSALEASATGWDWFSLQLDDGFELMVWQIRQDDEYIEQNEDADGPSLLLADGMLVLPDGTTRRIAASALQVLVLDQWQSKKTGIAYPSGWRVTVPAEQIVLDVQPLLREQELTTTIVYWEGAVRVGGSVAGQPMHGYGYVELTGYGAN